MVTECYVERNIEIWHDVPINVIHDVEKEFISITLFEDEYFRIITHESIIMDCVLSIFIEHNGNKKSKIIMEVGIDQNTCGFFNKLLNPDEPYVMYIEKYSDEDKNGFEFFKHVEN